MTQSLFFQPLYLVLLPINSLLPCVLLGRSLWIFARVEKEIQRTFD